MKKPNCDYIDETIHREEEDVWNCTQKIHKAMDNIHHLKEIKQQMLCEEDLSPEAVEKNQRLADELGEEWSKQ